MFKRFKTLCPVLCIFAVAYAAPEPKLIDFMLSETGVVEILGRFGILENEGRLVKTYINSSFNALGSKNYLNKQELMDVLSRLPAIGPDASIRKDLQILLDKPEKEIKKEDLVSTINNFIYLANRHGKTIIITCSECVNETLAKHGFKFTIENIKNTSSLKVLNEIIPKNPAGLKTYIASQMKKLRMGDYTNITPDIVAPAEEKTLALFLGLAEIGTADQKALIASIKKTSTRNGKTNILDPKNPQKFWKILSDDMSPQDMSGWTNTLDEVAVRADKYNITSEEAFYRTLKEKAQGNDYLLKQYETLKIKRCFFK